MEKIQGIRYLYKSSNPSHTHPYLYGPVSSFLKQVPPQSIVLDAGCGNGSFLSLFRGNDWILYGTDLSPTGIEIAQKTYPEITFFLADVQKHFEDFISTYGQVDAIISTEVIEHIYAPRDFLRSCFTLLKPGGTLVLSTPYHGYLKNLMLAATNSMDKHFTVLWDHGHIKFWSRKTLTHVLNETGFVDPKFAGAGRLPWLWKSMVMQCRKPAI